MQGIVKYPLAYPSSMRRLWILGLAVFLAGLAGCIGGDGSADDAQPQAVEPNDTGPTIDEPNVSTENQTQLYRYGSSNVDEVRWHNESFSPASCFACPEGEHRYDVTAMLAQGAPTLLRAEVDYEANVIDGTSLYVAADGAEVYRYNSTIDNVTTVLAPQGGTVEVVVQNLLPDAATEIDYELRIQALSNRSVVPAEVPVAFPKPAEPAGLVVDGDDLEGEARLMLWDGEDTFLGHEPIDGRTTINVSEAADGELVGYLAGADGIARLAPVNVTATDATMRPLAQTTAETAKDVAGNGAVEVEASPERAPLRAGMFLQGSNDAGTEYSGELTTGGETLLTFESGGYVTGPDGRFSWWSDRGPSAIGEDALLGTFEFSTATGGQAGVVWSTYQR